MSKSNILDEYGGNKSGPRAGCGGDMTGMVKDVNKYKPPVGPSGITGNNRPGLGGTNHGNCGTQGKR